MNTETKICPNYTLLDTQDYPTYEEYVDECRDFEIEPGGPDSRKYWDWVSGRCEMYVEDMLDDMVRYDRFPSNGFFVTGQLGLWNGRPSIVPQFFSSLRDAVAKCIMNYDDVTVKMEDGVLCICGFHHDGTNVFYIHRATDKGEELHDKCEENYEDLPDDIPEDCMTVFDDYIG